MRWNGPRVWTRWASSTSEPFEPEKWKPDLPHSGMANLTRRDGYWAAKIVSAFTDAAAAPDRGAGRTTRIPTRPTSWCSTLAGRRDKIARYWFDRVPPLDFFTVEPQGLVFHDLAVERGYADGGVHPLPLPPGGRGRRARRRRGTGWTAWVEVETTLLPISVPTAGCGRTCPGATTDHRFLAVEVQVDRGDGWSASTTVYGAYGSGPHRGGGPMT